MRALNGAQFCRDLPVSEIYEIFSILETNQVKLKASVMPWLRHQLCLGYALSVMPWLKAAVILFQLFLFVILFQNHNVDVCDFCDFFNFVILFEFVQIQTTKRPLHVLLGPYRIYDGL